MFKKGPDIDKKKLLTKALDVKKDSLTRLKHFKTLLEHLEFSEIPALFKANFSFIYHTFIDTFSNFDSNSKQRREDLDCILFMLEKILIFTPELIKKRWQFFSITFVMQKLLHHNNTWRLRQEGVRLFILWYQILCDESNLELQTMFASLVPGLVPQSAIFFNRAMQQQQQQLQQHSVSSTLPQAPIKPSPIEPLVPMSTNEQLPNDETSFYLDNLLQFMVTQPTKPFWSSPDEARKNQELSFSFTFNMFKKSYLQHIFPNFNSNLNAPLNSNNSHPIPPKSYLHPSDNHSTSYKYVDDVSDNQILMKGGKIINNNMLDGEHNLHPNINEHQQISSSTTSPPPQQQAKPKRDLQIELKQSSHHLSTDPYGQSSAEHERLLVLSVYQSIVIRWLTRILRQDMIPGQDELIKTGGSAERKNFQQREHSSGNNRPMQHDNEFSYVSDGNSSTIFQNMETTSREMEIARRVAGTWPDNIAVVHELFRRAFLNYFQPASMKRVVNVYKEWICNGGPNQGGKTTRIGYTSFGDLLQTFVLNSSNAFVTRVHNAAMLDEQVEMCKRIMNIYRYMVMKIYMNTATWEQLLNVMLSITEHLFPTIPPVKKESTIGGRIAPAFFQTFIVSWIRANLYVHISNQMWYEFHKVMKNLIRWRELIEEWSTTMGSLTRVLVKHVYGLSLTDLPLDKPQERRRRPRALKSLSTAETIISKPSSPTNNVPQTNASSSQDSATTSNHPQNSSRLATGSHHLKEDSRCIKGLTRSNSDGILHRDLAKLYFSSSRSDAPTISRRMRKIKSEYIIFGAGLYSTCAGRSNSPNHEDVMDGTSLKDPNMIIDNDQVMEVHLTGKPSDASKVSSSSAKRQDQKSPNSTDKCVLLGGSTRGWTPENSIIMWRRMLGLFGNINQIEDPDNHLVAIKCLAVILCDFLKTRENLGISLDNQSTPEQPELVPPYTHHVGWLLEATQLPRQFKESRLIAYKLLCLMSIRRHDIELPQQYYVAFYEALHRGLTSLDPDVHVSIIKNSAQLLSLELPGSTFLVQGLFERSRSILLNTHKEIPLTSNPRDQAIQILSTILSLHRPIKKLMVLKPEINNPMNLVAPGDIKSKIFDAFLACNMRPVVLDSQTRSKSLCSMTINVYQELCDKSDSLDVEKLFDTLLTDLQDLDNNGNMLRINCDLLRLFADHGASLAQTRPALVSSVIQILCQLIVRLSTDEINKEAIHCLLICLEDWCISVGKSYLLKTVDQLSTDEDDTLSNCLNESLITIVLRSLENVINDEQYFDDTSNKGTRGSMSTSKGGSDAHSSSHLSQVGSTHSADIGGDRFNGARDRTMTNSDIHHNQSSAQSNTEQSRTVGSKVIKLACKVSHLKLVTYMGHFPLRQVGAACMSCCVSESDYLSLTTEQEMKDFKNVSDVSFLVIDGSTVITFIGGQQQSGPVHLIVRNLCGRFSWDSTCIDLESEQQHQESEATGKQPSDRDSILLDPDSFQREDSRNSMAKYDSEFNEDGASNSSLSSRASSHRDHIGDLLNQLNSLITQNTNGPPSSSSSSSCQANNMYKKRNSAQSISNPKFKVAQAEETMIALLTNQRFQELNYCERSDDMDRVVLNYANNNRMQICRQQIESGEPQKSPNNLASSIRALSFEKCRQLIQQFGYLAWEKRTKIDSLAKSARLLRELRNLDSQPSRETHKIAVIYVANGQEDKNSILTNASGSRAFEDFVSGLGWEVNLSSHLGFKGGLQSNKSTGETSPYYCNSSTEVMFHVSTRLPITGQADDESLNKKLRHLGNDEIHIVWSEHSRDYRRGIIPTEFGDVIIAVYPMLTFQGYYRIQISIKQDVPVFGPLFDNSIVHQTSLASLVRATAINASRAKRLKLPYYQSPFEERSRLIESIVQNHKEQLSFEEFATQLYQTTIIGCNIVS